MYTFRAQSKTHLLNGIMQTAHSIQIVIDHKLQNVGHMRLVRLKNTPENSTILQQISNASHESRIVQIDLQELMRLLVVAIERTAKNAQNNLKKSKFHDANQTYMPFT